MCLGSAVLSYCYSPPAWVCLPDCDLGAVTGTQQWGYLTDPMASVPRGQPAALGLPPGSVLLVLVPICKAHSAGAVLIQPR